MTKEGRIFVYDGYCIGRLDPKTRSGRYYIDPRDSKKFVCDGYHWDGSTESEATLELVNWFYQCFENLEYIPFEKIKPLPKEFIVMITEKQFINLLKFLAIFTVDGRILDSSPDYIMEKFARFIGLPQDINDWENPGGVHRILEKEIIEEYLNRWKPKFKTED